MLIPVDEFASGHQHHYQCCFPSGPKRHSADQIELVPAAALPGTRRRRHNVPPLELAVDPAPTQYRTPHPYERRPSEDLQDLVDEEPHQDSINDSVFNPFDRAHGHVLRDLNSALQHSRWAISGSYAEALWGCRRGKRRNTVSIMCQSSSRHTTKIWLTSQSLFTVSPNDENVLQYRGDLSGADPVFVRIRWVSDHELERLQIIESTADYREGLFEPLEEVRLLLLSLPALADNVAWSWVKARDQRARDDFAEDLFSILDRIVHLGFSVRGAGPLSVEENIHILSSAFWIPFMKAYPHAPTFFAQSGAPIPDFAVVSLPPELEQGMQMQPPALRPDSFQKPRSAPAPHPTSRDYSRRLASPSTFSKPSSSSNSSSSLKPSSSKHSKLSSSSKAKRPSAKSKSKTQHKLMTPASPQRPVHPANIIHLEPEPRSKFSALYGLKESPETVARRRREQLENDRAARRASDKLAAQIQRNRERDRERYWHTRKQAERMGIHESPRNPCLKSQREESETAKAGPSHATL